MEEVAPRKEVRGLGQGPETSVAAVMGRLCGRHDTGQCRSYGTEAAVPKSRARWLS